MLALQMIKEWRSMQSAPRKQGKFFLVRPIGTNDVTGEKWVPSVVQRVDGKLYTIHNRSTPLDFGQVQLEWHPIPGDDDDA